MSSHEITHLLHEYGLGLVFAFTGLQALGAPLPGTTALVAAALYAGTSHGLPIAGVIAAGALGAVTGTTGGFILGRWRGERLLLWIAARLRQPPARVHRLRAEFAEHGGGWLFIGRFVSGLRNVTGLLAGSSGMPLGTFLPLSAAAALVWALVNGLEYYWFGDALASASTWVQAVLIGAGIAWMVVSLNLLRRRAVRRLEGMPPAAEADAGGGA
ncbi:MAG TPA: DedA family protein [Solirubrobacteraceae bacterium]|nr:DedA family protein [Solirubrobacteraceae bacterium]